jgi:hypothetical protein
MCEVGGFDRRVLYGDRLLDRQTGEGQTLDGQELDKVTHYNHLEITRFREQRSIQIQVRYRMI